MELYFLLFLLAMLGFYLVGVGAYDDPHGRGIDTYAEHVCRRRRDGSQYFPLFVLFILFGQAKRTLTEKFLYVSLRETNGLPYYPKPEFHQQTK